MGKRHDALNLWVKSWEERHEVFFEQYRGLRLLLRFALYCFENGPQILTTVALVGVGGWAVLKFVSAEEWARVVLFLVSLGVIFAILRLAFSSAIKKQRARSFSENRMAILTVAFIGAFIGAAMAILFYFSDLSKNSPTEKSASSTPPAPPVATTKQPATTQQPLPALPTPVTPPESTTAQPPATTQTNTDDSNLAAIKQGIIDRDKAEREKKRVEAEAAGERNYKRSTVETPAYMLLTMRTIQSYLDSMANQSGDTLISDFKGSLPEPLPMAEGGDTPVPPSAKYDMSFKNKPSWKYSCVLYRDSQGGGMILSNEYYTKNEAFSETFILKSDGDQGSMYSMELLDGKTRSVTTCQESQYEACLKEALRKFIEIQVIRDNPLPQ